MMEEEKRKEEVKEEGNDLNRYSDGNSIVQYMTDASSKADTMGRHVMYTLIAVLWAITYSEKNGTVNASIWLLISFICGILYVCLDFFYYFLSAWIYKDILKKHFKPEKNGGMAYKDDTSCPIVDHKTKRWLDVGCYWSFALMLLLLFTAVSLIIHVASGVLLLNKTL